LKSYYNLLYSTMRKRGKTMQQFLRTILATSPRDFVLLIRLMVGAVFLSEGIQKFLFPDSVGSGRFEKIGLPAPEFFGPFVGTFEIVCGTLVLVGLLTRLAVIPLLTILVVAIVTTKVPILLDQGFWKMAHAARTDFAMFLGSIFLLLKGAGDSSLDRYLLEELETRDLSV
jgi:putative oxidoreductase